MSLPTPANEAGRPLAVRAHDTLYLDTLLTNAPFGFVFLDRDLRFVRINDQLAEINGLSVAQHIGKTVAEIAPALEATLREVTARIIATGLPVLDHEFTGEMARAPGVIRTWNESWYPVRDERGELVGFSAMVVDITERKQAEAALRETEQHFQALAEASLDIAYRMSADWSMMLPLDGRALVASSDRPLTHWAWLEQNLPSDEHARVRLAISDAIARKGLFELEHRVVRPDGSTGWTFSRAVPILDENQHVVSWFGAASDITQRKQAQERLGLAIAGSDLGTWHWDIRAGVLDWSERCLTIFGFPARTEMSYEKFLGAIHPEDRARTDAAVQRALQDGSDYHIELRNVWPDGSVHWAVSLGRAYYAAAGEPTRMEGIALDITARKRAEAALRESEQHFQALAEASAEIPYRMSADWSTMLPLEGHGLFASSGRILANWAWVNRYLPRDEHVRVRQAVDDAIARKGLFDMEHRVALADGAIGWVRSRAVPVLDENDVLVTWFGAATDITERKRIEKNLIEANAAAEKANRAKSDFLSSMSHELRTPLNSILGFAQLLESGAPVPSPAQKKNLDHIIRSGWYLLDLVNEVLDLAQIESGKLFLAHEPFSLSEVILECRAMMEPQARERAITMTFPSAAFAGQVCADRMRVKQVVINLLSNAIKYNKMQGTIAVELVLTAPDVIRVSVRDTGEGLAPEKLAQLFQPFNRLGKETGPEQGTGIGLVMSKRLVELMGGSIGVDSTPGVGSVFWFELKWTAAGEHVGKN